MQLNFSELSQNQRYHLLTQTVVPRPIAWVLTENKSTNTEEAASYNLAPFSFFNAVAAEPPILMLGFTHKSDGSSKDTWQNLLEQKTCTIHLASIEQLDALVETSAELPYGASEVEKNNLHLANFDNSALPRLKDAPVAFACKLHSHQTFGDDIASVGSGVVFCEIMHIYINDEVCSQNEKGHIIVDPIKYSPPARLGGQNYATMLELQEKQRPKG